MHFESRDQRYHSELLVTPTHIKRELRNLIVAEYGEEVEKINRDGFVRQRSSDGI